MADEIKAVEFVAEIRQVKTMADHTVNVTLNLPEYCVQQAAWFMQHHGTQISGMAVLNQLEIGEEVTSVNAEETTENGYKRQGSLG